MNEPHIKPLDLSALDTEEPHRPGLEPEAPAANDGQQSEEMAQLREENAQLKDQLLRALAEAENIRRRAQKERDDTAKYAVGNFAKDILTVADNFQRALEALPKDAGQNESLKSLIAGIEATDRQLASILDRFGIKKLEPVGQPFDPNFHRVMMEVEDPAATPGSIVKVLQAGYVIHDRLLREALVTVAKGAAAPERVDRSA